MTDQIPPQDPVELARWVAGQVNADALAPAPPSISPKRRHLEGRRMTDLVDYLAASPGFEGVRLNLLTGQIEAGQQLPWGPPLQASRAWTWTETSGLRVWVYRQTGWEPTKKTAEEAIDELATRRAYHPIKNYLQAASAVWDGRPRAENLLVDWLGADASGYAREVARKTLLAAVTRVWQPGTKWDYLTVLRGPQGVGKSTLWARLAGDWFTDSLSFSFIEDPKRTTEITRRKWIVELPELAGLTKATAAAVKAFLSSSLDTYRGAYERHAADVPRAFICVGTTNETGFLRDETGNRRFLIVDTPGTASAPPWDLDEGTVEQIWGEVMAWWQAGETLDLTPAGKTGAASAALAALEISQDAGEIAEYLEGRDAVSIRQIRRDVFRRQPGDRAPGEEREIKRTLQALGWEQQTGKKWVEGRSERVWTPAP